MSFYLMSALGGAAQQYTKIEDEKRRANLEDARETQRWIRDNASNAFKEYKTKKQEVEALASSLKQLGLDDDKVLGLIEYDPEQARMFAQKAPTYLSVLNQSGKKLTANDLITITDPEYTGVSLDEGLDNIVGIYTADASAGEFDTSTPEGKAYAKLGRLLGRPPEELRAITTGDLTTRKTAPAISFTSDYTSFESLPLRKQMTELQKLQAETVQEQADASVAFELAGIKVAKEGMNLDSLTEQVKKQRNENADYEETQQRIRDKHAADMDKAEDDNTKRDIELRYLEDTMLADLEYTRARTQASMREDGKRPDPGVALKRYQGTFSIGISAATEMTELGKYLKMTPQPDGTYKPEFIGNESARDQVATELKDVTRQFLKGVFSTEGAQPAALAAAMSMNPMIDAAIVKAASAEDMISTPYIPYKYKEPDSGKQVIGYYDPEIENMVRVSYF